MPVRWPRSGGSTRRSTNTTRSWRTFPARRRGFVTACCCAWSGRNAEARVVFNELLLQMKRAPKYLREAQAEWLSIAEKQLSN